MILVLMLGNRRLWTVGAALTAFVLSGVAFPAEPGAVTKDCITRGEFAAELAALLDDAGLSDRPASATMLLPHDVPDAGADGVRVVMHAELLRPLDGYFGYARPLNRFQLALITGKLCDQLDMDEPPLPKRSWPADFPTDHWGIAAAKRAIVIGTMPVVAGAFRGRHFATRDDVAAALGRIRRLRGLPSAAH